MPTEYRRKSGANPRIRQWRPEDLEQALRSLNSGEMGVNEASRTYDIPSRTLRRRRHQGDRPIDLPLGPQGILGIENEKRLVRHIQKLEKAGFAPDRDTIRALAFQFAEKLGVSHRFNRQTGMAGYDWLKLFLKRNKELSVRQSQGLSLARSQGMNREEAKGFFDLLQKMYTENNMFVKPENIFNMDETGFQVNNEAGVVIATKGAKDVHTLISSERGENVSIIACCNAEGRFLPPVVIFKGQREKPEFKDGLPSGSKVYMNPKSSYISTDLFFKWFRDHFAPRKPPGRTILILDGHASHTNSLEMLEFAEANEIYLICLPSHTTQALQPLDRAFFKSLKHNLRREARQWMIHHPGRQLKRIQASQLIGKAWEKSASVETALSGFRATGIFPLDPSVIPDHFYAIADTSISNVADCNLPISDNIEKHSPIPGSSRRRSPSIESGKNDSISFSEEIQRQSPIPGPSRQLSPKIIPKTVKLSSPNVTSRPNKKIIKETPSKFLNEISPIPVVQPAQRKRKKQTAQLLNEKISKKWKNRKTNKQSCNKTDSPENSDTSDEEPLARIARKIKGSNKPASKCSSKQTTRSTSASNTRSTKCVECLENYFETTETVDWLECINCKDWYHETCSLYGSKCNVCGREEKRAEKAKKNLKNLL